MFQKRINNILEEYLDEFIIVHLNNNNIYLITKEEYKEHVKQVLKRL